MYADETVIYVHASYCDPKVNVTVKYFGIILDSTLSLSTISKSKGWRYCQEWKAVLEGHHSFFLAPSPLQNGYRFAQHSKKLLLLSAVVPLSHLKWLYVTWTFLAIFWRRNQALLLYIFSKIIKVYNSYLVFVIQFHVICYYTNPCIWNIKKRCRQVEKSMKQLHSVQRNQHTHSRCELLWQLATRFTHGLNQTLNGLLRR